MGYGGNAAECWKGRAIAGDFHSGSQHELFNLTEVPDESHLLPITFYTPDTYILTKCY